MKKITLWAISIITILLLSVGSYAGDSICDINSDGKTGLEEAIYALQVVAGLGARLPESDPCINSVAGITQVTGGYAVLNDDIDGTSGIEIIFTEPMDSSQIDSNSIVIYDRGINVEIGPDDYGYIDFAASLNGNTLTITTADPISAGHHIDIYLLKDDFRDLAGNFLDVEEFGDCIQQLAYVEPFTSANETLYALVKIRIHSPDIIDPGEVTDLIQECSDSVGDAGLPVLNASYPIVFSTVNDNSSAIFYNLNADTDYKPRLEALADIIGQSAGTGAASISNGYARISFMPPSEGSWSIFLPGGGESNPSTGPGGTSTVSALLSGVEAGEYIHVESIDDFGNVAAVTVMILVDCVAPTTVLNFGNNTCGIVGNAIVGIADNAAEVCALGEVAPIPPDIPGVLGLPTINITPRLLYDPNDLPAVDPISVYGLYAGSETPGTELYDATEFEPWRPFPAQVDVAFSEDIRYTAGGNISWVGTASILAWFVENNMSVYTDGSPVDGGVGGTADLVHLFFQDLLDLANQDHGQILDMTNAVEDTAGIPADYARVFVNDLMPPFVVSAYWDGDLVINFNEPVDVCTDVADDCTPTTVSLMDPTYGGSGVYTGDAVLTTQGAALSVDGMTLTIPSATISLSVFDRGQHFPGLATTGALVYAESVYDSIIPSPLFKYNHGRLNWDEIPDANNGNTWADWKNGTYRNTSGNAMVKTPEFAPVDAVGPFIITSFPITPEPGDTVTPFSVTYAFSLPIDYSLSFAGCTGVNNTQACANNWLQTDGNLGSVVTWSMDAGELFPSTDSTYNDVTRILNLVFYGSGRWTTGDYISFDPGWRWISTYGGNSRNLNDHVIE